MQQLRDILVDDEIKLAVNLTISRSLKFQTLLEVSKHVYSENLAMNLDKCQYLYDLAKKKQLSLLVHLGILQSQRKR